MSAAGASPATTKSAVHTAEQPRALRARVFGSAWEWKRAGLGDSLLVLLRGPAPPSGWPVGPYFPDAWIRSPIHWRLIFLSALLHVLVVIFPLRMRFGSSTNAASPTTPVEVAWMGGSRALLPYIPSLRSTRGGRKTAVHSAEATANDGTPAFHPRQTIVSNPVKATHPRQTLIEPAASPEAPKILPPLPNIVEWPNLPQPATPRRHLRVNPNTRMRHRTARAQTHVVAPEIAMSHKTLDTAIISSHPDLPKPALEVKTAAHPTFAAEKVKEEAAPEIAPAINTEAAGQRLIALSETPAPPPPELQVPAGNLSAQFALSPEGHPTSTSGGSGLPENGKLAGTGGHSSGVPGVAVSAGKNGPVSDIVGPPGAGGVGAGGGGSSSTGLLSMSHMLRSRPQPGVAAVPASESQASPASSIQDRIKAGVTPEHLLEPGRVYTLHVSMPNLASATGTWTLKFVELDENGKEIPGTIDSPAVAGPVPLRKVDPKYPPSLVTAKVQGDVILYAIIRRDGSVDSIEIVKSLDPLLDQNAMQALSRWRFQAAQRQGHTVELATIVRIPFRAISPLD